MAIRGWVYIITNKAMPNLVKIGFSTKDPNLRAKELDCTGCPHPYVVVYDVLVENPYDVEQKVHKLLVDYNEGKEWFRCSINTAINSIRNITKDIIIENIDSDIKNELIISSEYFEDIELIEPSHILDDDLNDSSNDDNCIHDDNKIYHKIENHYIQRPTRKDRVGDNIEMLCKHCGLTNYIMVSRIAKFANCTFCGKYLGPV